VPTKEDLEAAKRAFERADKARIKAMTEDQADAAAEVDPDNPPLTEEELARAWRVTPVAKTAAE
jgi:hypothetical protein